MTRPTKLTQTAEMRQLQRLTPMQVQLVRMLEMSAPELEDEVQRALDEMPALEAVPDETGSEHEQTEDGEFFTESDAELQRADYRGEDDMPEYLARSSDSSLFGPVEVFTPRVSARMNEEINDMPVADDNGGLISHLQSQIDETDIPNNLRAIVLYIIGSIDDNGYLTRTPASLVDDLAINEGMEVSLADVNEAVRIVRSLDPPGVGAMDLRQCLLLQLERMPSSTRKEDAIEIVRHYFDLFTKKHFQKIGNAAKISQERIEEAVELITHLNPKPAGGIAEGGGAGKLRHITPDFFVEADSEGTLHLTMLNRLPELRVEASFANDDKVAAPEGNNARKRRMEEARIFIRTKREDARNFIRTLQMRNNTMMQVMSAIVKIQHDFFANSDDDERIVPMVLRDIGAITNLDLSVISRATQGKYVATLHGVYPLKKFFNEKMSSTDEALTTNKVMSLIKKAVEGEKPSAPLSDERITRMLVEKGFNVARRTVAKYRERLGIPVARLRKSL